MTQPEIRLNDDGTLDEVCAPGFHLEQLDEGHWFMEVEVNGQAVAVWLYARGEIKASYERRARQFPDSKRITVNAAQTLGERDRDDETEESP